MLAVTAPRPLLLSGTLKQLFINEIKREYLESKSLLATVESKGEGLLEFALKVAERSTTGDVGTRNIDSLGTVHVKLWYMPFRGDSETRPESWPKTFLSFWKGRLMPDGAIPDLFFTNTTAVAVKRALDEAQNAASSSSSSSSNGITITDAIRKRVVGALFFSDIATTNNTKSKLNHNVETQLNSVREYQYTAFQPSRSARGGGNATELTQDEITKLYARWLVQMHQEHDQSIEFGQPDPSIPNRYSEIKFNGVTFKKDDCFVTPRKLGGSGYKKTSTDTPGFKNVQTTFLMRVAGFEAKRTEGGSTSASTCTVLATREPGDIYPSLIWRLNPSYLPKAPEDAKSLEKKRKAELDCSPSEVDVKWLPDTLPQTSLTGNSKLTPRVDVRSNHKDDDPFRLHVRIAWKGKGQLHYLKDWTAAGHAPAVPARANNYGSHASFQVYVVIKSKASKQRSSSSSSSSSESLDASKSVVMHKALLKMAADGEPYFEIDMQPFLTRGFTPNSKTRAPPKPGKYDVTIGIGLQGAKGEDGGAFMFQNLEDKKYELFIRPGDVAVLEVAGIPDEVNIGQQVLLDTLDIAFRDDLDNDTYVAPKSRVSFSIKHGDQPQSKRGLRICDAWTKSSIAGAASTAARKVKPHCKLPRTNSYKSRQGKCYSLLDASYDPL